MLCAYTRPRYQVSVDMTIGPLVLWKGLKAHVHVFVTIAYQRSFKDYYLLTLIAFRLFISLLLPETLIMKNMFNQRTNGPVNWSCKRLPDIWICMLSVQNKFCKK